MVLPGGSIVQTGTSNPITVPDGGGVLQPGGGIQYTVTVRFDSQGGSEVTAPDITVGSTITEPAQPTRECYSFTGWYQDAACTALWDFTTPVSGNLVLYAGWSPISSGSGGGGSSSSGTVSGSGSHVTISAGSGSVTAAQMTQAVNKADPDAVITVHATGSSTISLPAGGLSAAAGKDNDVRLNLRLGSITLPAAALSGLTESLSSSERIDASITRLTSSTSEEISVLLEQDASVFAVTVTAADTEVHSFAGPLTITFTVSNLAQIEDPQVLHMLSDGSQEYYAPSQISGNQITVSGIRSLSVFAVIPGSMVPQETVNPFVDISDRDYFYEAVLWAVENGITAGTSPTTFGSDDTVTRGQAMTFLYRAAGSPSISGSSFGDVPASAYYADAVAWAVSHGITSGTGTDTFSPNSPCTRAQIVTFLYRDRV